MADDAQRAAAYARSRADNTNKEVAAIVALDLPRSMKFSALLKRKEDRIKLARIYAEDGALSTAHTILGIDVPIIERAIEEHR